MIDLNLKRYHMQTLKLKTIFFEVNNQQYKFNSILKMEVSRVSKFKIQQSKLSNLNKRKNIDKNKLSIKDLREIPKELSYVYLSIHRKEEKNETEKNI